MILLESMVIFLMYGKKYPPIDYSCKGCVPVCDRLAITCTHVCNNIPYVVPSKIFIHVALVWNDQ